MREIAKMHNSAKCS